MTSEALTLTEAEAEAGTAVSGGPIVELVPYQPTLRESLRELWEFRGMLRPLGSSVLKTQFGMTILGLWWVPITVLFATVGRTVIFGRLLNVPSPNGVPYFLFMLTGTLAWTIFDRSLIFTLKSFRRFSRLTRELSFPLGLVPIAATAQGGYQYLVHGALVLVCLVAYSVSAGHSLAPLDPSLLLAPLGVLWCIILAWGIGFFLAPIYARARDVRFLLRMAMPFWMYLTPIVYPLSAVGDRAALLARLNPIAAPVELFKRGLLGIEAPSAIAIASSTVFTLAAVLGGLVFINRYGPQLIGIGGYDFDDDDAEVE